MPCLAYTSCSKCKTVLPLSLIHIYSALREGWDNPNIFQICTLKESGSETSKRQEVGRGLRLAVDKDGNRQDVALLGASDVHRVNLLTVIASESYESFVKDLQADIGKSLRCLLYTSRCV